MQKKIKVFNVDDSPVYRQILREIVSSDDELEYCGSASNGAIAIQKIQIIKPDIITLDIEMPEMNGLQALRYIMENNPIPVIMISAFTKDGADITFKALELGALDYIQKPDLGDLDENIKILEDLLITKLKAFSNFKFFENRGLKKIIEKDEIPQSTDLSSWEIPAARRKITEAVCIGSSTGGTIALSHILPLIRGNIGIPIFVVQHMPKLYTASFAKRLDSLCSLRVLEAQNGMKVEQNTIYIAQGGYHMTVENRKIILNDDLPCNSHKPSVDVLFNSVEKEYSDRALAIILTGMGADGAKGLAKIKDAGGFTIAQDEDSSVIFGMPGSAVKTGKVDRVIPLNKIAYFINNFVKK
jgi:two-component system, chemotaxis family, protein-glutamate methylesterase/glutaminase